jgi:hypothetical protein
MTTDYPLAVLPHNRELAPWLAQMQGLDLSARRQVLKRFKPTPMPPFLYKYLSSDREFSLRNVHDVLVRSILRLNFPNSFNDPFEMTAHFVMIATQEEKLARFESLAREQAPYLGWRAVQARVRELMAFTEECFMPRWQQSLKNVRESAGVCCFAGNAKNRLMWGHYASNHKGICLQFERVRDIHTLAHAFRVRYSANFPILNWIVEFHQDIGKMLFSKDPCWEYEQESRILIYEQGGRYLPLVPDALRKLIFGCRAEPAFVDTVMGMLAERDAAGYSPVEVYFARQHTKMYRLVVSRRK